MKKFLSMALILLLLCNMTLISFAEEKYPISGTIAETDINWSLTEDGVLTVTGTGKFPEDELSRWEYADNVVKIVISEGITDIGDNSFCGFVNLSELQLPDTLLTIGSGAFGCWSDAELTVNIPKNLNRIGPEDPSDPKADIAFNGVKIKSFNVNPENPVFYAKDGALYEMFGQKKQLLSYPSAAPFETFVTDAQLIKFMCIKNAKNLKTLVLTDAESFSYPLDGCYPENVYLGASVTGIDVRNFYGEENGNTVLKIKNLYYAGTPEQWESVKKLYANQTYVLPEVKYGSLEYDGTFAIGGNKDEILNIPEEINGMPVTTLIGDSNDVSSKIINIPKTVTAIKDDAFESCYELTEINVDPENKFFTSENGILYNKDKTVLLKVPEAMETLPKLPSTVTQLGVSAFSGCRFAEIDLPENINKIGDFCFSSSAVEKLKLPDSIRVIPEYAFGKCYKLERLEMPKNLEYIENNAFYGMDSVGYVTIYSELKRISDEYF